MGKKGNFRATGGQPARTRTVSVLANPNGNRAERRAAAKVARMSPEQRAMLPRAAATPPPTRWNTKGRTANGR